MKNLKSRIKEQANLLIILLLWVFSIYTIIEVNTSNVAISKHHYIGIATLLVTTIVYFFNKNYAIALIGIALFAGTINAVEFLPTRTESSFIKGAFKLSFQPLFSILLLVFLAFNYKAIVLFWFKK